MPIKKATPKVETKPIPQPELPPEELTEEKLAAPAKEIEVAEKNQSNFMEDLTKSEPLQQFKEESVDMQNEKLISHSSKVSENTPPENIEAKISEKDVPSSEDKPTPNKLPPAKEIVDPPLNPNPELNQTQPTQSGSSFNGESSRPKNENFIDDLYKLSRAKSSPIPKLLFLIALVIGLGLGVFYYYQSLTHNKPLLGFLEKPESTYTPVTKENLSLNLEIISPDDEMLVYDKTIIVSGKTNANARLVVNNANTYTALQANDNGEFSKVVDLNSGTNQIVIYAFDENGNTKTETRTIYYSEEKI